MNSRLSSIHECRQSPTALPRFLVVKIGDKSTNPPVLDLSKASTKANFGAHCSLSIFMLHFENRSCLENLRARCPTVTHFGSKMSTFDIHFAKELKDEQTQRVLA